MLFVIVISSDEQTYGIKKRKGIFMKRTLVMIGTLGIMGLQAAEQGYYGQPPSSAPMQAGFGYQLAQQHPYHDPTAALEALQLARHESHTDQCYRSTGPLPVPGMEAVKRSQEVQTRGHRRERSLSADDIRKNTETDGLFESISSLPPLSQAPMQKLLTAALQLQKLAEKVVQAHYTSLQELETTPGTNTVVRQAAEQQMPKARKRVDDSTKSIEAAIQALTERVNKAKK